MLSQVKKAIRKEIAFNDAKILSGQFGDYTGVMVLIERRKTLLNSIEIINETLKLNDDEDDDNE